MLSISPCCFQRIRSGAEKLKKARVGKQQARVDSYFTVLPSTKPSSAKRKGDEKAGKNAKKGKSSSKGGFKPRK